MPFSGLRAAFRKVPHPNPGHMGVVTCSVVGCDRLSLPNRAGLVGAPPVVAGDRPFDRVHRSSPSETVRPVWGDGGPGSPCLPLGPLQRLAGDNDSGTTPGDTVETVECNILSQTMVLRDSNHQKTKVQESQKGGGVQSHPVSGCSGHLTSMDRTPSSVTAGWLEF